MSKDVYMNAPEKTKAFVLSGSPEKSSAAGAMSGCCGCLRRRRPLPWEVTGRQTQMEVEDKWEVAIEKEAGQRLGANLAPDEGGLRIEKLADDGLLAALSQTLPKEQSLTLWEVPEVGVPRRSASRGR